MTDIEELRARVEALEAGATCPHIVTSDESTSYCGLAEQVSRIGQSDVPADTSVQASQPTPKDRQIRSSLVRRVALAISGIVYGLERDEEAVNWTSEARAAIREVAEWLRQHYGGPTASSTALEQEAEQ